MSPDYPWDDTTFDWVDGDDIPAWLITDVLAAQPSVRVHHADTYEVASRVECWVTGQVVWYCLELSEEFSADGNVAHGRTLRPEEVAG